MVTEQEPAPESEWWQPDVAQLLDLINATRPQPVADTNGDMHCTRLWPVAKCQWVFGHYGGCATA